MLWPFLFDQHSWPQCAGHSGECFALGFVWVSRGLGRENPDYDYALPAQAGILCFGAL